jgi:hypothetical protein
VKIWKDIRLPEGKVLVPGVLDTTTNFVEHPELVAERIIRFAEIAGRETVIAGTDCGFGTFAGFYTASRGSPGSSSRPWRREHRSHPTTYGNGVVSSRLGLIWRSRTRHGVAIRTRPM